MGVKLVASGGGSVEINPPSTSANFIATMPAGTGTVAVNGASTNIVLGTPLASTSGTSIDFTGIPSWVRRITVMFNGVSTNGSSPVQIQLGAGSVQTTSYFSGAVIAGGTNVAQGGNSTTGLMIEGTTGAAVVRHGSAAITSFGSNIWTMQSVTGRSDSAFGQVAGGSVTLSGTLDRVRITTVNGTDVFDAGSVNIMYE